jgi:hypothetical protein
MVYLPIPFISTMAIIESGLMRNLIHVELMVRRTSKEERNSERRFMSIESLILGMSRSRLMVLQCYKVLAVSNYHCRKVIYLD